MDKVKITCYGKTEIMDRNEAMKLYREGIACCDGSEKERYATILCGLMIGRREVSDED